MSTATATSMITHDKQVELIQNIVCRQYSVTRKELLGNSRPAHIVRARQVAMAIARELLGQSTPWLATAFNRTDHGTILWACNNVTEKREIEERFWNEYEALKAQCCTALGIPPMVKKWGE